MTETNWQPGDGVYDRPTVDPELRAAEDIVAAFGALNHPAQARVLRWAYDRYVAQED